MSLNIIASILFLGIYCFPGTLNAEPQEEPFEIARLPGADYTGQYDIASDPQGSKIVVVWRTTVLPGSQYVYAATISNAAHTPSVANFKLVSSEALVALNPQVVNHPEIKRFLVIWEESGTHGATLGQDITGRLLAANGKPKGKPLQIIREYGSQGMQRLIPWLKSDPTAPGGAAFYVLCFETDNVTHRVIGQWLTKAGKPVGAIDEITTLENFNLFGDALRVGKDNILLGLIAAEPPGLPHNSPTTLRFLRFSPLSPKSLALTEHKGFYEDYDTPRLLKISDKKLLASAITDRKNPSKSKLSIMPLKNRSNLKTSRKEINLTEGNVPPEFHELVLLDNGDSYSVASLISGTILIQRVDSKGKVQGEPVEFRGPIRSTYGLAAIAIPGEDAILVVFGDLADNGDLVINGIVFRP